ncbi:MAG TPA: hypothetical protein PLD25_02475 [Chloroflexota bacterium]|nr:hypothetical protein [Chloroflexota bacterium]HUM71282.1 hypothetical protein [Chloroflexota bacterium]
MSTNNDSFPSVQQLRQGAILGTIAHAIWLIQYPDFAHEQSWDGINYSVQDSQGTRGTITFSDNDVIGVFRDENSRRSPLTLDNGYDLSKYFAGIPPRLMKIAEQEALQYVLEEYQGSVIPIVTAAFWSNDKFLAGADSWKDIYTHGAHVLRVQILDTETAIKEWQDNYEMSAPKVALMRSLFNQRLKNPKKELVLTGEELIILKGKGSRGIEESRELFAGINIVVP